jgi:nicotinate-nucleotide adenylyltransferase
LQQRLGILGGTFNPIHLGHLLLAQEAFYRFELKRVIFVPAARNPLKAHEPEGITTDQRLKLLRLATEPDSRFSVDAGELRQPSPSYTVDTLRRIHKLNPGNELYLLLGADAAAKLPKWKDIERYPELCRIAVTNRPGAVDMRGTLPDDVQALNLRIEFMPVPPIDISASDIRSRVRNGKPIRYLVPDAVAEFIHEHGIYKATGP